MALTAGTKLGPYEIQSPLGAGGMRKFTVRWIPAWIGQLVQYLRMNGIALDFVWPHLPLRCPSFLQPDTQKMVDALTFARSVLQRTRWIGLKCLAQRPTTS